MYWIIAEEMKHGMVFGRIFIINMGNCNLSDFKKELLFAIDVQNKFLVTDICSEMPSDSK